MFPAPLIKSFSVFGKWFHLSETHLLVSERLIILNTSAYLKGGYKTPNEMSDVKGTARILTIFVRFWGWWTMTSNVVNADLVRTVWSFWNFLKYTDMNFSWFTIYVSSSISVSNPVWISFQPFTSLGQVILSFLSGIMGIIKRVSQGRCEDGLKYGMENIT